MNKPVGLSVRSWRGKGLATLALLCFCLLFGRASAGPLSERLVFVARVHKVNKIFVCRTDGRDLQRLTEAPGEQLEPYFSVPLQRFFFVRYVHRRHEVYSVNLEGLDLKAHTFGKSEARNPHVSPDGSKLIYSTDKWGALELAEVDLATGKETRMTYDQATNRYARYSPDGKSIAFLSSRHGQSELYLRDLASGGYRRLTDTPFNEGPASWRPDGRRLVATRSTTPRQRVKMLEIDLETGVERMLLPTTSPIYYPAYSADGTLIVYVRDQAVFTYDPSDTAAQPFPMRGQLQPEYAQWATFPLP